MHGKIALSQGMLCLKGTESVKLLDKNASSSHTVIPRSASEVSFEALGWCVRVCDSSADLMV